MNTAPRAILFDLDGTLLDVLGPSRAAIREVLAAFAAEVRFEDFCPPYFEAGIALWEEYLQGRMGRETLRVERIRAPLKRFGLDESRAAPMAAAFMERFNASPALEPGARDAVKRLSGRYPLGIVTNGFSDNTRPRMSANGLDPFFRTVVISEEFGVHKPAPSIFEKACRDLGVAPAEAAFVGDSLATDVAGARALRMRAVWYNRFGEAPPGDAPPDLTIRSLSDLAFHF